MEMGEAPGHGMADDTASSAGAGVDFAARQLSRMNEQLNKLTELVNDLLDVSKIEAGKLDYHMQEVDFNAWISEYVEDLRPLSGTYDIVLNCSGTGKVVFDMDRIGQVLTNLVTNAIKYSPGSERIIVSSHVDADGARVGVQDFGIGIPESDLERVFDRFYQSNSGGSEAGSYPGLGLGLYISAQIVRRHGGTIRVESEQGKGSTFYFELPAIPGSPTQYAEA
jgi:signal transduction histidine kinase